MWLNRPEQDAVLGARYERPGEEKILQLSVLSSPLLSHLFFAEKLMFPGIWKATLIPSVSLASSWCSAKTTRP